MDITRPPLDRQVAPAPWLVFREYVNLPDAIRQILAEKPKATADEIAEAMAARGVQVSRMIVAMWLNRLKSDRTGDELHPAAQQEGSSAE